MLQLGKQLSPEQRLTKCTTDILSEERFTDLAPVLMVGIKEVNAEKTAPMNTACTNGRDEWYHPDFIGLLTDAELRFVILHETFHKLYRHLITWVQLYKLDADSANKACDFVINLLIMDLCKDGFATMPKAVPGCLDEKYRGWNAKQVFDDIRQDGKQGGGGEGDGKPLDQHDWEGAEDMTPEEQDALDREIDQAIRQGALTAGKLGHANSIDVHELLKPQVDWKQVLRDFIKRTIAGKEFSTYKRINRRYMAQGIIMPSGITMQVGELLICIDMSGSTGVGKMRPTFLTECQQVCDLVHPELFRLMYWDNKVRAVETYTPEEQKDFFRLTKPVGGGGTTFECVDKYIKDNNIKPQAVIVLTDGDLFGGWGSLTCPTLWLIVDNPDVKAPYGKTINIDSAVA